VFTVPNTLWMSGLCLIRHWNRTLTLTIIDCEFMGNRAGTGEGGNLVTSGGFGGAMFLASGGDVALQGLKFDGNTATSSGGGALLPSTPSVPRCHPRACSCAWCVSFPGQLRSSTLSPLPSPLFRLQAESCIVLH
jgi:hypothetical protein